MTTDLPQTIRLNLDDNVIIALKDLAPGATVPGLDVPLGDAVYQAGHQFGDVWPHV